MTTTWVPFTLAWDDAVPLDLSFVFEHEKPAGKHGFLTVKGDKFVFADGSEGRFWGTCFNSGANFPSHEYSQMVARRMAKFGLNIMRTHQMDSEWATPNLFTANRLRPRDNTRSLDPDSLEKLDYLFYCLKEQGVYIYLDLLTYRQFRPGDGVDAVDALPQAAKPYHYFDRRLIELQKEFNTALWTHVNPYTGLAYKDDPAIALTEIVNESDPFLQKVTLEPYRTRLEGMYKLWTEQNGAKVESLPVDFSQPTPQVARFLCQVMQDYYREMIAHMRSIGVKIPINGTNWSINLGVTEAQMAVDYCDSHCYWNFPTWEDPNGTVAKPMVGEADNTLSTLSLTRLQDRPFFVSEWDHAWPDPYRAESALFYAAAAAFQGWGGATIHTYRYSTWTPEDRLGGGASTINSITYRNHFDAFNDPAKFGLFYQAALLFRRGDVRPAEHSITIRIPDDPEWLLKSSKDIPALQLTPEKHRVGLAFDGEIPADGGTRLGADLRVSPTDRIVNPADGAQSAEITSDTHELWRSWWNRIGTIDTPRTKAAYGFLGKNGVITLNGLDLEVKTDFATICLSSLNDDSIEDSDSLLLTAVGRCDNTAVKYSEDGKRQLSFGHAPILIEAIEARVSLRTRRANLKVWVISEHGEAVTKLPVTYKDGVLSFEIGPQPDWNPSTMYYLIKV